MTYKLKVLQQGLEQEEAAHKATKARLADKSKISESIEGAKSEAVKGIRVYCLNTHLYNLTSTFISKYWCVSRCCYFYFLPFILGIDHKPQSLDWSYNLIMGYGCKIH